MKKTKIIAAILVVAQMGIHMTVTSTAAGDITLDTCNAVSRIVTVSGVIETNRPNEEVILTVLKANTDAGILNNINLNELDTVMSYFSQKPLESDGSFSFVFKMKGESGDYAVLAGAIYTLGAGPDDQVVKEGLVSEGKLQIMGAMYRIGGVNYDGFIEYIKNHPEKINIHPYGLMSHKEIIETLKKGDSIILNGTLTGEKYHTEQGYIRQDPPLNYYQIYNYPREGIAVGCVTHILTDELDGTKIDDVVQGEYEVLYCAKRQVARLREEVGGFENAFVLDVPQVGVRETRHIVGEYKIDIDDVLESRTFPDTIGFSTHPCDIGPLPKAVKEWDRPDKFYFSLPYRCLVAKGLDNLLLAGRLISNSREAAGCTRPTVACMVTGEAAGTAAALLSKDGKTKAKDIDAELLRNTLKKNGVVL